MFESKFYFSLEDNIAGTIYTSKKKNKKLTIVVMSLLILGLILAIISMVINIILGENFAFDIILMLIAIGIGVYCLTAPKTWKRTAINTYNENIAPNNYCIVQIDKDCCKVSFYKEEVETSKVVLDLNNMTACFEDDERFVLVFNKTQFVIVRKDKLSGGIESLRENLEQHLNDEGVVYVTKKN